MIFLIIPLMSILARMSGGGLISSYEFNNKVINSIYKRIPEVLFAIIIGSASFHVYTPALASALTILSFFAMEMGHGTFYTMDGYKDFGRHRIQTIEKIVRPIYNLSGLSIYSPAYSWFCMGVKGLLIGIAMGYWGLLLAVLWPTCYWIGHRIERFGAIAEYLSGMVTGVLVVLCYMH